jgi:hypothetical protein
MCVCMCVNMWMYGYVCGHANQGFMYTQIHTSEAHALRMYVCVYMHTCIQLTRSQLCINTRVNTSFRGMIRQDGNTYTHTYVCVHIYAYLHMWIRAVVQMIRQDGNIYIYIYIYTHTFTCIHKHLYHVSGKIYTLSFRGLCKMIVYMCVSLFVHIHV